MVTQIRADGCVCLCAWTPLLLEGQGVRERERGISPSRIAVVEWVIERGTPGPFKGISGGRDFFLQVAYRNIHTCRRLTDLNSHYENLEFELCNSCSNKAFVGSNH